MGDQVDPLNDSDWSVPPLTVKGHLASVVLDDVQGVYVTVRVPLSEGAARRVSALMMTTGNNIDVTFPPMTKKDGEP